MINNTPPLPTLPVHPEVAEVRIKLRALGYAPVPVATRSKRPLHPNWGPRARSGEFARVAVDPRALSTGIECSGLRALDIDIDDEQVMAKVLSFAANLLPACGPIRYRTESIRILILYRAAEGEPSKRTLNGKLGSIEILGAGQQFVANGAHEKTGEPYRWSGDEKSPFPGCLPPRDGLPAVSEEQLTAFLVAVAPMIGAVKETSAAQTPSPQIHKMDPTACIGDVVAALSIIPNPDLPFDPWKSVLLCVWAATRGSDEGREACREWSRKSQKHNDDDFDEQWDGISRSPPSRTGFGSLVLMAQRVEPAWTPPSQPTQAALAQAAFAANPLKPEEFTAYTATRAEFVPSVEPAAPASRVINPADLIGVPVPRREWLVPDWIPVGAVTALYGDGGVGKTLLAQQLMTACATGHKWCGSSVLRCKSFGLFCEDDEDELHRRQEDINAALGLGFDALVEIRWSSGAGEDNSLASFSAYGEMAHTDRYRALERDVIASGARLVVLDTAADLFAGNENDRGQVRRFIGLLSRLALKINGAVLLNAHPSRQGQRGDIDGGSTAWNNSVRARLTLSRPDKEHAPPDPNMRVLKRRKSNYSGIGDEISLRWIAGALIAPTDQGCPAHDPAARAKRAQEAFLTMLRAAEAKDERLSRSRNAVNFAPKMFVKRIGGVNFTSDEFHRAMDALYESGQVIEESYGKASAPSKRIRAATVAAEPPITE